MRRKTPEVVADCFQLMKDLYFTGPWVMGEHYSIADPYLFTLSQWLPIHGIDSSDYPNIYQHLVKMLDQPAVQKALVGIYSTSGKFCIPGWLLRKNFPPT